MQWDLKDYMDQKYLAVTQDCPYFDEEDYDKMEILWVPDNRNKKIDGKPTKKVKFVVGPR